MIGPNDFVAVKLTDYGRSVLRKYYDEALDRLTAHTGKRGPSFDLPTEDADGWSKWQLWALLEELGPHCHAGSLHVFSAFKVLQNEDRPIEEDAIKK